nr:hypothetical protein [uncultured Bacteroides sp.]
MKKILLFSVLTTLLFCSCQEKWEESKPSETLPIILTYEQELDIVNNYTVIDTINHSYSVLITDSIMQAEHLTDTNIKLILKEITRINNNIEEDIKAGITTTLTLNNNKGFQSYSINPNHFISFRDEYIPANKSKIQTRAGLGGMSFSQGSWNEFSVEFYGTDHVTSKFYVDSCRGYWHVNVECTTGTSSYGNTFSTYGTRYTSGTINRYWWSTVGGQAPFRWYFKANGPVGGEANGGIDFSDTI